ncbi:MAG: penicillin-binding protein 2 [Candidatus Omnitrophica bacterium]|nr:penicillin-binding protein 2 [Candidatus Omnitrophota bacterium]
MDKNSKRIDKVYLVFIFLFSLIVLKITYLQLFKQDFFKRLAHGQHYKIVRIEGKRGNIFDNKGRILATGMNFYSIFADPSSIKINKIIEPLAVNLSLSEKFLKSRLEKKKKFVWIKRRVSWEIKERIKSLQLKGVGFIREEKRVYPQNHLAASVLGITDIDNKGLEGLELYYNKYLRGKDGFVRVLQDSAARQIILSSQIITPQRGDDILSTIDAQIQYWTKTYLEETIKKFDAKQGSVVVMDASTGEIRALANYPSFNPNNLDSKSFENIKNKAICDMFEPGSVMKIITLIAAISENKTFDNQKIFCENGKLKIPGSILHDWKPFGELTFREVFLNSSNIGIAKIVQAITPKIYSTYIKKLGFGEITGVDLKGEVPGSLKSFSKWSKTSNYIIPIGQEIGVNLLQLARGFAVIVNGGYLVQPHLISKICSQGVCETVPYKKKKVLSSLVADKAKDILIDVVFEGTGKRAGIEGRKIGGKTGTAQKYDPKIRKYSSSKYRATFIGFIADLNSPLVIAVTIDEPLKSNFGGVVAAPVFRNIADKVIKYIEGERFLVSQ